MTNLHFFQKILRKNSPTIGLKLTTTLTNTKIHTQTKTYTHIHTHKHTYTQETFFTNQTLYIYITKKLKTPVD